MEFIPTTLADAMLIRPHRIADARGSFTRVFCADTFRAAGLVAEFVQMNHSSNRQRGTLRGLHYQSAPHGEVKLVRVVAGAIHDVIVDLREDSPTHMRWQGFDLSAEGGIAHRWGRATCATPTRPQPKVACAGMIRPSASAGRSARR